MVRSLAWTGSRLAFPVCNIGIARGWRKCPLAIIAMLPLHRGAVRGIVRSHRPPSVPWKGASQPFSDVGRAALARDRPEGVNRDGDTGETGRREYPRGPGHHKTWHSFESGMTDIRAASIDAIPFGSDVKRRPAGAITKESGGDANGLVHILSGRRVHGNAYIQEKGARHRCGVRVFQSWLPRCARSRADARNTRRKCARRARSPADPIGNARFRRSRVIG